MVVPCCILCYLCLFNLGAHHSITDFRDHPTIPLRNTIWINYLLSLIPTAHVNLAFGPQVSMTSLRVTWIRLSWKFAKNWRPSAPENGVYVSVDQLGKFGTWG